MDGLYCKSCKDEPGRILNILCRMALEVLVSPPIEREKGCPVGRFLEEGAGRCHFLPFAGSWRKVVIFLHFLQYAVNEYCRLERKPPVTAGLLAANILLPTIDEVWFISHVITCRGLPKPPAMFVFHGNLGERFFCIKGKLQTGESGLSRGSFAGWLPIQLTDGLELSFTYKRIYLENF